MVQGRVAGRGPRDGSCRRRSATGGHVSARGARRDRRATPTRMAAPRDLPGDRRHQGRRGWGCGHGAPRHGVRDCQRNEHLVPDQSARRRILPERHPPVDQRNRSVSPPSAVDCHDDSPHHVVARRLVIRRDGAHAAAPADRARRVRRSDRLDRASAQRSRRREPGHESTNRLVLVRAVSAWVRDCRRACRVAARAGQDVAAAAAGGSGRNRGAWTDPRARRRRPAMNRPIAFALCALTAALLVGCDNAPGRRAMDEENVAPDRILDFDILYRTNCAGCHGPHGRGGAALALANPTYLAIADADVLRRVTADGIAGTPMPASGRRSGAMLTDQQIDAIVNGIRARWANPSAVAAINPPPYSDSLPGDARRGGTVFATYCASCHGDGGRGARGGSSIVDGSY